MRFVTVPGDLALLQAGLDGEWDAARFLTIEPGQAVRPCYDEGILAAEPAPCGPAARPDPEPRP